MVDKPRLSSGIAAFVLFLAFPALASAHTLAVSAGPSACVSPLNGQYSATVTITENYFGGTTEDIPVGQNVRELSSSTDRGNTGLNQNYFTQGAVGTQTGPANLGQPTVFTSPASGGAATQRFTVTTSVPETYVLGNSYMGSPSSATITAPHGGCTPPPPPPAPTVSATESSQCTTPLNGTYIAAIDVRSNQAFNVPAGTTTGSNGLNFLTPAASGVPSSFQVGDTTFTITGLTQSAVYVIQAPGGNLASVVLTAPSSGCQPPPPTPTCSSGQTMSGGQCVNTPPTCAAGQTLSGGQCVTPPPTCAAGQTMSGGQCINTTCASGQTMSGGKCVSAPPTCGAGQTMSGGKCVTETCPAGEVMSSGGCTYPPFPPVSRAKHHAAACVTAGSTYRVRAGQLNTIVVWVRMNGTPVAGARVRLTLPLGKTLTRTAGPNGTVTFTVKPNHSGTIYVQSTSCAGATKVKVFAPKVAAAHQAPAFTG